MLDTPPTSSSPIARKDTPAPSFFHEKAPSALPSFDMPPTSLFTAAKPTITPPAAFTFAPAAAIPSFLNTTPAAPAPVAEEEETVGQAEATVILKGKDESNESCTLEIEKVKLMQLKESAWADKGVHVLKVLKHNTTGKYRYVNLPKVVPLGV